MRMIKSGHYSKAPWTGTASCPDCKALMAIEEVDLRVKQNMWRTSRVWTVAAGSNCATTTHRQCGSCVASHVTTANNNQ